MALNNGHLNKNIRIADTLLSSIRTSAFQIVVHYLNHHLNTGQ